MYLKLVNLVILELLLFELILSNIIILNQCTELKNYNKLNYILFLY